MACRFNSILFLVLFFLPGCLSIDAVTDWSTQDSKELPRKRDSNRTFNINEPADRQAALVSVEQRLMISSKVKDTPPGSQVHIVDESGSRFAGTLSHASSETVELMNCVSKEVVPGPSGHNQCKTSHTPFHSLKISEMTHFLIISHPPDDFTLPDVDIDIDTNEVSVAEIVYKNGRRQQWEKAPVDPAFERPGTRDRLDNDGPEN